MVSGKRIFMVGGAGFIGSALLPHVLEDNEVVVYDTFERDALSGSGSSGHANLKTIEGDVLDAERLAEAMSAADLVVHLAAVAGVPSVVKRPTRTMRVNMLGTANVLEAALERGCERVICFSTSEVFGTQAFRAAETDRTVMGALGEARWTYAVSKLAGEHLAHGYHKEFGLGTVVIRPFNVYGPGQVGEGAIHTFVNRALAGEDLEIRGDGTQIRAWLYIDDIVRALLSCLDSDRAIGESFNIGNARAVITVYGLANAVLRITGSKSQIKFIDVNEADVELRVPNVDKAREVLGFEAEIDLEEGLRRTADWYREHGPTSRQPAPVVQ
jgi:UDP-glucose 4-epimerase